MHDPIWHRDHLARAFSQFRTEAAPALKQLRRACVTLLAQLGLWAAALFIGMPQPAYATNNLIQYNKAAKEQLYILGNMLAYAGKVDTRYEKEYRDFMPGSQITIKKKPRYVPRRGSAAQIQGINEQSVVVTVQPEIGVDIAPTQDEMALILGNKISDWSDGYAVPAAFQVASTVDNEVANAAMLGVHNLVGTPGNPPSNADDMMVVTQRLDDEGNPGIRRWSVINPLGNRKIVSGIGSTQWRDYASRNGDLKIYSRELNNPALGFDGILMSQSTPARTVGVYSGTPVINGAGQSGSSLSIRGFGAGSILNQGDVIHIANVNAVNYQTRKYNGSVRQFVVQAAAVANAAGVMNISIYPALNPPIGGQPTQFQTVDSFPADGATVSIDSGASGATYQEGLGFYTDALGLISIPLFIPDDAAYSEELEYKGIGMRWWMGSDVINGRQILRIEGMFAFPVFQPEGCCRFNAG